MMYVTDYSRVFLMCAWKMESPPPQKKKTKKKKTKQIGFFLHFQEAWPRRWSYQNSCRFGRCLLACLLFYTALVAHGSKLLEVRKWHRVWAWALLEGTNKVTEKNSYISVSEICSKSNLSRRTVETLLHDDLHMRKIFAGWLPDLQTEDQLKQKLLYAKELLKLFGPCGSKWSYIVIMGDETWSFFNWIQNRRVKSGVDGWKWPGPANFLMGFWSW